MEARTKRVAHTAGEWRPTPYSSVVGAGVMAQPDPKQNSMVLAMVQGRTRAEAEANARLIAAAPDLLTELRATADAAREMIRVLDDGHDWEGLHHSTPERGAYDRLKLAAWNAERIIDRATAPTPTTESHD
jgi:hypothetical protein